MNKIFAAIGLLLLMQSAWAIDIRDAKDQGLVGEANSGYIAAVQSTSSAEVRALIADVNNKRKAKFAETAKSLVITAGVPFGTPGATNVLRIAWIN